MSRKHLYSRRLVFALLIVFTAVFQFSFSRYLDIGGVFPILMLPLIVSISMFENSFYAIIFGFFAGVSIDIFSMSGDGFFSVCFTLAAFASSSLITFLMRRTFVSSLLFTVVSSFLINLAYWLIIIVIKGYDSPFWLLLHKYIPTAVSTIIPIIVFYPLIKLIFEHFSGKEGKNEN